MDEKGILTSPGDKRRDHLAIQQQHATIITHTDTVAARRRYEQLPVRAEREAKATPEGRAAKEREAQLARDLKELEKERQREEKKAATKQAAIDAKAAFALLSPAQQYVIKQTKKHEAQQKKELR